MEMAESKIAQYLDHPSSFMWVVRCVCVCVCACVRACERE